MGLDPARDSSNRLPSRNLRNDKTPIEIPCGFAILVVHGSDRFVCSSTFLSLDEDGSVLPTERQNCYEKDSWSQNQPKRGSQLKDLRKKGVLLGELNYWDRGIAQFATESSGMHSNDAEKPNRIGLLQNGFALESTAPSVPYRCSPFLFSPKSCLQFNCR